LGKHDNLTYSVKKKISRDTNHARPEEVNNPTPKPEKKQNTKARPKPKVNSVEVLEHNVSIRQHRQAISGLPVAPGALEGWRRGCVPKVKDLHKVKVGGFDVAVDPTRGHGHGTVGYAPRDTPVGVTSKKTRNHAVVAGVLPERVVDVVCEVPNVRLSLCLSLPH